MIAFRVLVVDDDDDDRDFLREALERAGVEPVLTLPAAQDVFTYLQSVERDEDLPRLIITDLNMPGITGYELLQALRPMNRYQRIPVIICSTSNHFADITKCAAAGAKKYIPKPNNYAGYEKVSVVMKQYVLD